MDFKVNTSTIVNVTPKIYEIYPRPQNIIYTGGEFQLNKSINIVYDNGIDSYTKNRVTNVLKLQNLENTVSNGIVINKINFLVGINKSNGIVDQYFSKNISYDKNFFINNIDSYLLIVKDGIIGVLGKNTDSAFYGITTLKHIFNQIGTNKIIQNFRVDDYANIAYRGFIEGYYGNPWSNDDRAELMKFGGDYKLNQYVFAPKDDVYHNKNWRDLYPKTNLVAIQKLAMVGNQTKNRYVYALHPFMYNPIRFNTDSNYQADLNTIRQKFNQLLQIGVRQFAILADDASEPTGGPSMYVKLLTDLTTWLKTQQATYSDLKTDLMFCPSDYMGDGQSTQLRELNKASSNVSIVVTGGKIWGEVDENFSNNFINNIATSGYPGRAPFYWINWPCSDNSKKHLIIGGNNTFLHPGITPSKINGIILNPMQQAEANKSALFAISDYAWNIWDTKQQGDQNWYDSFKYMDHGTSEEIKSSFSLREISKHMINQNMDGRVTRLEESLDLAPKLINFNKKYNNGDSIKADAAILIGEFTKIKDAATYYKNNPSNGRTRDAIIHWLNCWQDTTTAVISYLTSIIAIENGDGDLALKNFLSGQSAFEKSKTYGFFYVDHTEYAEVGVQYIVPFIVDLGANLSTVVSSMLDPSKAIANFITNRIDSPTGIKENIFDQNPNTELVYKTPNNIDIGTFVGVKYSTLITLNKIEFLMGTNANLNDTMKKAKLQYTVDDKIWLDLESGKEYDNPQNIKVENLNLSIKGVRLIETVGKSNTWLGIRDINVNKTSINYLILSSNSTLIRSDIWQVYQGDEKNITDKNDNTDVWYKTGNGDTSLAGEFIGLDLGKTANLYQIRFVIGRDGSGDKWRKYKLEYSIDNKTWIAIKSYDNSSTPTGKNIILESFQNPIVARYVRITNLENISKWVIFSEISIYGEYVTDVVIPFNPTLIRSDIWQVYQGDEKNITDKNDNTDVWYKTGNGDISLAGEFIGFNLGKVAMLDQIRFVMGRNGSGDKWRKYKLEYSIDNKTWITIKSYDNSSTPIGKDIILENFKTPISANYIRFTNLENINKWLIFTELSVVSNDEANRGNKNNIYTNTNLNIYSIFSYNLTKLKPFPALKLNSNEYVGIKLDRIKALSKINFDATNIDKLVLQTSLNEIEWLNISNTSVLTPARYIRIRNNSTSPVIFDLNKFEILSNEITAPKLVSAYIGDTGSEKAVDGDLKTSVKFNGPPKKGDTIVYDLGQEILINNLKYVVLDTEKDHIRDGKIQLSLDGITWIDAITIGDGIENSVTNADSKPVDNGYTHGNQSNGIIPIDSAYMEGSNLNIKARYVRIFITASYAYRWIVINELMINNGQYIPIINDPTFVSNPIEERGFAPSNLIDGKLTTSYKPNTKNGSIRQGSLTYRLSEKTDVKKIIIVQDGNTISNAIVTAKVIDTTLGVTSKLTMLGSLSKTLNIFTTNSYKNVLEIKISWNKIAPNIYEIITL